MSIFPDLSGIPYAAVDHETTGVGFNDRPVGMSVSTPDGRDWYFAWGHQMGGNNCTLLEVTEWVEDLGRRNPGMLIIMFNAGFDLRMGRYSGIKWRQRVEDAGFICALLNELEPEFNLEFLAEKYTDVRKDDKALNDFCAQHFGGAATRRGQAGNYWRAPGTIVAPYAKSDSRATLRLWEVRHPLLAAEQLESIYKIETAQIPILLKMHMVGVRVDQARAHDVQAEFKVLREAAWNKWRDLTQHIDPKGIKTGSNPMLMKLFDSYKIPYVKNEDTGNGIFDKDTLSPMRDQYEVVRLLLENRELKHYDEVFLGSYILDNVGEDGCIHGEFHPLKNDHKFGTVSGRYSSGGALNLQNIPKRDKIKGPLIRSMYVPFYEDQEWTKFDYSQIEYRFLAHYAGGGIAEAYRKNPDQDFHALVAAMTNGAMDRDGAKTLNFALTYGQGDEATAAQLGVPLDVARDFIRTYKRSVPEASELYDRAMRVAASRGYIITWGGRRRRFEHKWGRFQKSHKGLNALLQGSAADLIKMAMIEVDKAIDWEDCILHLTVHDELDFSTTKGDIGDGYRTRIKELMQDYKLDVPIIAECDVGPNWGHVKKWVKGAHVDPTRLSSGS